MKKILSLLIVALATLGQVHAQKAIDVIPINEIFDLITYRYITLANEDADATAVIENYTKHFKAYGYVNELVGEGYGGPCSIIDGFHKGGVHDKENYEFIPSDPYAASTVVITACNDGESSDYGYIHVELTLYSRTLLADVLDQLSTGGFTQFDFDNPCSEGAETMLFYNGNKQVHITTVGDNVFVVCSIAQ